MNYARRHRIPPKHIEPRLVTLRDSKVHEFGVESLQQLAEQIKGVLEKTPGAAQVEYETEVRHPVCTLWFPYAGSWGYAWYVPKAGAVNVGFGGLRSELLNWDRRKLWQDFVVLLQKEGCIADEPPEQPRWLGWVHRDQIQLGNRALKLRRDAPGHPLRCRSGSSTAPAAAP